MKLSMSLIAGYLAPYQPECHILEDTQTITGIRFFSDRQVSFSREQIYLGSAKDYFQDPRYQNALLLANGRNQILCRSAEYEDLLNAVLSAFDFYRHLEERLLLSAGHCTLKEILSLAETVILDPFLVFNLDGTLLGCVNQDKITDSELIENIQTKTSLGSNIIGRKFVDKNGAISHDLTDYPQHLHPGDTSDIGAIAMYLMQQDERVGFTLLLPSTTQRASAGMCLLPLFARAFAASAEFAGGSSLHQSSGSVLLRLLKQEEVSDAVLVSLFERLSAASEALLVACQSISIRNYTHRHLLMREIAQLPGQMVYCEYQECIVVLLAAKDLPDLLACIRQSVPEKSMAIGVSMPIQDQHEVFLAWQQTRLALDSSEEPGIRYCQELALPSLLNAICENDMACHLLHPACFQLARIDAESHLALYHTLQTFLFLKMSRAETARQLHIHLNTLKYRLNRIEDLCGIDFGDPWELFYLQLSFAVQEHCRNRPARRS